MPGLSQTERQRHREAAGVGGSDQLLATCAGLSGFSPGPPGQRLLGERAARHTNRAAPTHEIASPCRVCPALNGHLVLLQKFSYSLRLPRVLDAAAALRAGGTRRSRGGINAITRGTLRCAAANANCSARPQG